MTKEEFLALYHLKKNLPEAMLKALDKSQSKKEQEDAMFLAAHTLENNNPACDNIYESRSHILSQEIYADVFKKAGIPEENKTKEWIKTI